MTQHLAETKLLLGSHQAQATWILLLFDPASVQAAGGALSEDDMKAPIDPREAELLKEIGVLTDRVREMRRPESPMDGLQIKALEGESRSKWEELRLLRAGPVELDNSSPRRRGMYI